jgi:hypothetical protein
MLKRKYEDAIEGLDGLTLGDFWAWGFSDVLNNRLRSLFAEFLVGHALGLLENPRVEWDSVDFRYTKERFGIEVKASGYVQSWHKTNRPSPIKFEIAKKFGWDSENNSYPLEAIRSAACYVFCLHTDKEISTVNPLNIASWQFYVVTREVLEANFGNQKSIVLNRLERIAKPIKYSEVKQAIDTLLGIA